MQVQFSGSQKLVLVTGYVGLCKSGLNNEDSELWNERSGRDPNLLQKLNVPRSNLDTPVFLILFLS